MAKSSPGPQLLGLLSDYEIPVAGLALALCALVIEAAPQALKTVYGHGSETLTEPAIDHAVREVPQRSGASQKRDRAQVSR